MNDSNKPVIIKNLRKLFEDVEKKEEFNEEIKLIANSGIQFIDFEHKVLEVKVQRRTYQK